MPGWKPEPYIELPLMYSLKVQDWTDPNYMKPSTVPTEGKVRRYMLVGEETMEDKITRVFSYREVE